MNRPSPPPTRDHLGDYLNECGYTESGAEVGVLYGNNAATILSQWKGKCLYAIDSWRNWPSDVYEGWANFIDMGDAFVRAQKTLSTYKDRVVFQPMTSVEAAGQHDYKSLNWVYIDANHSEEHVTKDMEAWWPCVESGGVLCGHDYIDGYHWETHFGVKSAVDKWAAKNGRTVLTTGDNFNWFIFKD